MFAFTLDYVLDKGITQVFSHAHSCVCACGCWFLDYIGVTFSVRLSQPYLAVELPWGIAAAAAAAAGGFEPFYPPAPTSKIPAI